VVHRCVEYNGGRVRSGWCAVASSLRSPVSGFGSGLLGLEGGEAAALEGGEDLVIALPAITLFLSKGGDVSCQTLAFDEHEEAASQFVGGFNGEAAGRAGELVSRGIEL